MSNFECVGVLVLNAVEFSECLCCFGGALLRVNDLLLLLLLLFLCCLRLPHVKPKPKPKPTYRMTHEPCPIHFATPTLHHPSGTPHFAHNFCRIKFDAKSTRAGGVKKKKKERKIGKGEARKRMSEYKRAAEPATTTRSELGPAAV